MRKQLEGIYPLTVPLTKKVAIMRKVKLIFTTTYHNGGASTTAINNPYTYRDYYYDKDLGF